MDLPEGNIAIHPRITRRPRSAVGAVLPTSMWWQRPAKVARSLSLSLFPPRPKSIQSVWQANSFLRPDAIVQCCGEWENGRLNCSDRMLSNTKERNGVACLPHVRFATFDKGSGIDREPALLGPQFPHPFTTDC